MKHKGILRGREDLVPKLLAVTMATVVHILVDIMWMLVMFTTFLSRNLGLLSAHAELQDLVSAYIGFMG